MVVYDCGNDWIIRLVPWEAGPACVREPDDPNAICRLRVDHLSAGRGYTGVAEQNQLHGRCRTHPGDPEKNCTGSIRKEAGKYENDQGHRKRTDPGQTGHDKNRHGN